jgi:hypothetical protein
MTVLDKGKFDIFYNKMHDYLVAYRNFLMNQAVTEEQKAYEHFYIGKNYLRYLPDNKYPAVILYPPDISPINNKSAVKTYMQYTASYTIDLLAGKPGTNEKSSDDRTVERLLYLIQQVKCAIWNIQNTTFETVGQIGHKSYPTVNLFMPSGDKTDIIVVGAQMTFSLELYFQPPEFNQEITDYLHRLPVNLEEININNNYGETNYDYI